MTGEYTARRPVVGLGLWLAATLAAGFIGSQFPPDAWYAALAKPDWNPPNSVFGPVWTTLYVLMGISAWLVWRKRGFDGARTALLLFGVQLLLNALWSWLFFGLHAPGLAFAEMLLLWLVILATLLSFRKISPLAGWLLVPYLLWVSFAAVLNLQIWRLNM